MLIFATALLQLVQAPPPPPARFPDFPEQDTLSYALDFRVDLSARRLEGSVDYRIRTQAATSSIRFHARRSPDWRVRFVDAERRVLPAEWKKQDQVTVRLPAPVAAGTIVKLRAELQGRPVDGFYFKKNRYGKLLAFTDHYSIRARGWLPCEDHPAERARFSARFVYPEGNEAVAYGAPAAIEKGAAAAPAGYRVLNVRSTTEIPPYMFAFVMGPFARVVEAGDPRLRPHLVYAEDVDKAKAALRHHGKWIAMMEQAFGPYSYTKYTTVQCPTRWGGFEAPGNVQLSERLFDAPGGGVGTLAHELVHMWFGDAVGYARWREVWLSEGFASYFGPWLHARAGGPTMQASMARIRQRWRRSGVGRIKTVRDDRFAHPDLALNANTYPKGAWVLHMLRRELGDEKFFAALKAYYKRCVGRSVVTKEFIAIVQEVTERDLGWFFEQWLDRVDCPRLRVAVESDRIIIEQVQKGPEFRFWLELQWTDAAGKSVDRSLQISERRTVVTDVGAVRDLLIDPDVQLLFRQ